MEVRYPGVTWRRESADVGPMTHRVITLASQDLPPRELNFEVNWVYHDIGERLTEVLGDENANWAVFAKWASLQVGTTMYPSGVKDSSVGLRGRVSRWVVTSKGLAARLLGLTLAEVNRGIFWEVGYALARFVDKFGSSQATPVSEDAFDDLVEAIRAQPWAPGKLWNRDEGDSRLIEGLHSYLDAISEKDPTLKAQLVFQGSLLITDHEQRRIQHYLEVSALSGIYGVRRAFIRWLTPGAISMFPPLKKKYDELRAIREQGHPWGPGWGRLERAASRLTTWFLGTWIMGRDLSDELRRETLKMSRDVPPPRGATQLYPPALAEITVEPARSMLAEYDSAEGDGTAVKHWVDIDQRMRFTAAVFRSRQQESFIRVEPYPTRPDDLMRKLANRSPCERLVIPTAPGEPSGTSRGVTAGNSLLPPGHVFFEYQESIDPVAECLYSPPFEEERQRLLLTACRGGILAEVEDSSIMDEDSFPPEWRHAELEQLRGTRVERVVDESGTLFDYFHDDVVVDTALDPLLRGLVEPDPVVGSQPEPVYQRFREMCQESTGRYRPVWERLAEMQVPRWFDVERARRGQAFYAQHLGQLTIGLLFSSLPASYACTKGVQVLYRISTLGRDPYRRIMYTAAAMQSWMTGEFWERTSNARHELDNVRLLHALVRLHARPQSLAPVEVPLLDAAGNRVGSSLTAPVGHETPRTEGEQPWDPTWGAPVNQEDLLGTVLAFAVASVEGARRLNGRFSDAELDDWMHAWCGVGALMGVDPDNLLAPKSALAAAGEPEDMVRTISYEEARVLALQIGARQFGPSQAGSYLGSLLLDELEWVTPGPASIVRALIRIASSDFIADCVSIPAAGNMEDIVRWVSLRRDWLAPGTRLNRFAGKLVKHTIDSEVAGYTERGAPPVWAMSDVPGYDLCVTGSEDAEQLGEPAR